MGNERNIVFNEEKTRKTRWTSFWLLAQEKRAELENSKNERAAGTQSSEARRIEEMEVRNEQTRGSIGAGEAETVAPGNLAGAENENELKLMSFRTT